MSSTTTAPETLFVQLPDVTPRRVLHACQVLDFEGRGCRVQAIEPLEGLQVDATMLVYFEERQRFVQQPARVRAIEALDGEAGDVVHVELLGEPVDAEQRQVYRVSCLAAPIHATMNNEPDCEVVDISATGFGVICSSHFHVGASVTALLHWDGQTYRGPVVVVSVRQVSEGRQRYGVRALEGDETRGMSLFSSLTRVSLAVQREQMRRVQ